MVKQPNLIYEYISSSKWISFTNVFKSKLSQTIFIYLYIHQNRYSIELHIFIELVSGHVVNFDSH